MTSADRAVSFLVARSLAEDSRHDEICGAAFDFKITPAIRRVMVRVAVAHYEILGIRACVGCACTDEFACTAGCSWIDTSRGVSFRFHNKNLCSACVPRPRKTHRRKRGR